MDHGGQNIRLSFKNWSPYVTILEDGSVTGINPGIASAICSMLNLTMELDSNS